jgi:hypothetical protein
VHHGRCPRGALVWLGSAFLFGAGMGCGAEMFQTLEAAVQDVARDLELLNRYLVRALTAPSSDPTLVPTP